MDQLGSALDKVKQNMASGKPSDEARDDEADGVPEVNEVSSEEETAGARHTQAGGLDAIPEEDLLEEELNLSARKNREAGWPKPATPDFKGEHLNGTASSAPLAPYPQPFTTNQ